MTHQIGDDDDTHLNNLIQAYVHYGEYDYDYRFPILVLQQRGQSIGFKLNSEDISDLERTCICAAKYDSECCCGAYAQDSNVCGYNLEKDEEYE